MGRAAAACAMVDNRGTQGLLLIWCGRIDKHVGLFFLIAMEANYCNNVYNALSIGNTIIT
jgi:hypothetical protein